MRSRFLLEEYNMTKRFLALTFALLCCAARIYAATPTVVDPKNIVRQELAALSRGDVDGVVALFSMDARVYRLPEEPRRLVGELSTTLSGRETMRRFLHQAAAKPAPQHYEIIDMTSIGELVVARLKMTMPSDYDKPFYMLTAYRVQDGLIHDLWHIGRSDQESVLRNTEAQAVIERLVRANNQGDVETFLAQFDKDARNYRRSEIPFRLSGQLSSKIVDQQSRTEVFRAMFGNGAPVQAEPIDTLVFGDLVVAREKVTRPDGAILDQLSIYRVRDGRIQDDWFVAAVLDNQ
jgi:hypothetical protein